MEMGRFNHSVEVVNFRNGASVAPGEEVRSVSASDPASRCPNEDLRLKASNNIELSIQSVIHSQECSYANPRLRRAHLKYKYHSNNTGAPESF